MPRPRSRRHFRSLRGQEYRSVGPGFDQSVALQARKSICDGCCRDAQSLGKIGRPGLALSGGQFGDQLDIIFLHLGAVRGPHPREPPGLLLWVGQRQ